MLRKYSVICRKGEISNKLNIKLNFNIKPKKKNITQAWHTFLAKIPMPDSLAKRTVCPKNNSYALYAVWILIYLPFSPFFFCFALWSQIYDPGEYWATPTWTPRILLILLCAKQKRNKIGKGQQRQKEEGRRQKATKAQAKSKQKQNKDTEWHWWTMPEMIDWWIDGLIDEATCSLCMCVCGVCVCVCCAIEWNDWANCRPYPSPQLWPLLAFSAPRTSCIDNEQLRLALINFCAMPRPLIKLFLLRMRRAGWGVVVSVGGKKKGKKIKIKIKEVEKFENFN